MKDIPVFTTEHGVASLFLREIPYRKRAHIKLQATQDPEQLLQECIAFCRACGAEWIDAAGHSYLEHYPLLTALVLMQRPKEGLERADACLFPVTEETVDQWRDIYNERMADIPNCAFMDSLHGKEMLEKGDGYFIHRDGIVLGIGRASGNMLDTVISTVPGEGETVVRALAELLDTDTLRLQVASENKRAIRLYERLGFLQVRELSRWYQVLG